MKKSVYLLSAFAAASMLLASCSNEDVTSTVADGQLVDVQFVASLSGRTASRSVAEGDNINKITYAVYLGDYTKSDFAGTPLALFSDGATSNTADMSGLTTTVPLKLAKGKTYSIVFWAYHNDATAGSPYTFNATDGNITVSYDNAVANDDTRDAFFAVKTFYVSDDLVPTVTLYRPFAQINLATNDFTEYKASYEEVKQSYVKVTNVGNKLNFFGDTAVEGNETATFALADIPSGEAQPVSDYDYLAYAYILPSSTVDVTYGVEKDTDIQTVTSVPAKANYRTNIYGSLLTNAVDFKVTIEKEFAGNDDVKATSTLVTTGEALATAIAKGADDIVLEGNVTLDAIDVSDAADDVIVDLNGFELTLSESAAATVNIDNGSTIHFQNGDIVVKSSSVGAGIRSRAEASRAAAFVVTDGELWLQNVNIDVDDDCAILVQGADAKLYVVGDAANGVHTSIKAKKYAVSTNGVNPIGNDTPVIWLNYVDCTAETPVLIDVPATVTLRNGIYTGTSQAAILRGGTYDLSGVNFNLDLNNRATVGQEGDATQYLGKDWGDGNNVPVAAVVIGNRNESAYQYKTYLACWPNGCYANILDDSGNYKADYINTYVYANSGDDLGVYHIVYRATQNIIMGMQPICKGNVYGSSNIYKKTNGASSWTQVAITSGYENYGQD
jgi:hypothetical protein